MILTYSTDSVHSNLSPHLFRAQEWHKSLTKISIFKKFLEKLLFLALPAGPQLLYILIMILIITSIGVRIDCSYAVAEKLCIFLRHEPIPFISQIMILNTLINCIILKEIRDGMPMWFKMSRKKVKAG